MSADNASELLASTATIVAAHLHSNQVATEDLPMLIRAVRDSLTSVGEPERTVTDEPLPRPEPAVPINESVQPDYIVCLEDGKKFKSLKRHLRTAYGMTPEEYRTRWGLSFDYPMTAPSYSEYRSQLAVSAGLGRQRAA